MVASEGSTHDEGPTYIVGAGAQRLSNARIRGVAPHLHATLQQSASLSPIAEQLMNRLRSNAASTASDSEQLAQAAVAAMVDRNNSRMSSRPGSNNAVPASPVSHTDSTTAFTVASNWQSGDGRRTAALGRMGSLGEQPTSTPSLAAHEQALPPEGTTIDATTARDAASATGIVSVDGSALRNPMMRGDVSIKPSSVFDWRRANARMYLAAAANRASGQRG